MQAEYNHYINSTRARNADSWIDVHYESDTMRNDFRNVKVISDSENVYFRIETVADITPFTDNAWMRLFIDTDSSGEASHWEGFEYVIDLLEDACAGLIDSIIKGDS